MWRLSEALQRLWTAADLVTARVDRIAARLLFGGVYLRVPEWVDLRLELPENLSALWRGSRNRDVANDLRRVRRHGLTCEVSHAPAAFDLFYDRYYVPFVQQRHGEQVVLVVRDSLRQVFQRGGVLWVVRGGERIAGALYRREGKELRSLVLGTREGDYSLTKVGALVAIYYFEILQAAAIGCTRVNLGGSQASLTDGSLRYKRKWGPAVVDRPESPYDFTIHWSRLSEPMVPFLKRASPVFRTRAGFAGVSALECSGPTTDDDLWPAYRFLRIPGLNTLFLVSRGGWEGINDVPPRTCLLDQTNASSSDLLALAHGAQAVPLGGQHGCAGTAAA